MPGLSGTDLRRKLAEARLYLCTDMRDDLAEFVDAALEGGVDIVQLRAKTLEARQELAALEEIAGVCAKHGALLSVNDRADIAAAVGADVLHLGQDDLPVRMARQIVGEDMVIGRSTHDVAQAKAAATEKGVDYFCTGPCWPTPTKPGRPAPGLDLVRETAAANPARPWFAIGGIDDTRLPEVLAAGATRVVVVRAITEASDPRAAAASLKSKL
ncbi:thiamine-phosphate pyrophosphorylase [Kibdelosporangium banguiense]|uniref:Thiamine-phosphate synthase n=1 Tax=Kibdelosporangium banguiense TaxID=1365924 RepID=A0ABS4TA38_9PSEU|nr:thiamine phosphate synthase [Kibdelosporangium banguiense]MBP2321268.1 thiamine-phosphate pyrophosphorylase [Kibdelosporangium banguiense]